MSESIWLVIITGFFTLAAGGLGTWITGRTETRRLLLIERLKRLEEYQDGATEHGLHEFRKWEETGNEAAGKMAVKYREEAERLEEEINKLLRIKNPKFRLMRRKGGHAD